MWPIKTKRDIIDGQTLSPIGDRYPQIDKRVTGEGTNARMIVEWLKIDPKEDMRCGEKKKTGGETIFIGELIGRALRLSTRSSNKVNCMVRMATRRRRRTSGGGGVKLSPQEQPKQLPLDGQRNSRDSPQAIRNDCDNDTT